MVPNKSLAFWFCFPCVPKFMADPQKVSALLIYFCDLPDLANLRFLFSAKWSRHKIIFFLTFFCQNLIRVHSNAEKKITTTKRKETSFFFDILAEGDAGILNFFQLCFFVGESDLLTFWAFWKSNLIFE
jgi:hypothetical protein